MSSDVRTNDQDHGVAARDASTETDADRNSRASHSSSTFRREDSFHGDYAPNIRPVDGR